MTRIDRRQFVASMTAAACANAVAPKTVKISVGARLARRADGSSLLLASGGKT